MISMLDLDLLSDTLAEHASRSKSLAIHAEHIRKFSVRVLWDDSFEPLLPWHEPAKREWCIILSQLFDYLRGNNLFVLRASFTAPLSIAPEIEPPLTANYPLSHKSLWEELLCDSLRKSTSAEVGLAVLTWDRFRNNRLTPTAVRITNSSSLALSGSEAIILYRKCDWQKFIENYFRPNMSQYKLAILGGDRARVERAGRRLLDAYMLGRFRYLAPSYEQNRTKRQTLDIVESMDLVILCTNRVKHMDSDHVKGASVPVIPINQDSEDEIIKCAVAYFLRSRGEA